MVKSVKIEVIKFDINRLKPQQSKSVEIVQILNYGIRGNLNNEIGLKSFVRISYYYYYFVT